MTAEKHNRIAEECLGSRHMDWSIFEYQEAHTRDRFFMLREGDGVDPGIFFYAVITSEPYKGIVKVRDVVGVGTVEVDDS